VCPAHTCVEDRHRSREFIGFLKRLDAAYSADTAIKVILDNHSAHVSKETKKWLAAQREGRFSFVFTPKEATSNRLFQFLGRTERDLLLLQCAAPRLSRGCARCEPCACEPQVCQGH
jgi:hypothetical protein